MIGGVAVGSGGWGFGGRGRGRGGGRGGASGVGEGGEVEEEGEAPGVVGPGERIGGKIGEVGAGEMAAFVFVVAQDVFRVGGDADGAGGFGAAQEEEGAEGGAPAVGDGVAGAGEIVGQGRVGLMIDDG
jgi:hypothetical protein